VPAITYGPDGEGRPNGVTTNDTPATLVKSSGTAYGADGLTALALDSGDSDAYAYAAATGRMTQYQFTVGGQTDTGQLTWNANGSLASLAITDNITGTSDSQICDFTHDDLGRISTANCGSGWDQTFDFDPFGNLNKTASAGTQFSASFNLKNEITSVGGVSASYDSDGNLLNDPSSSNTQVNWFDADGHATTFNNTSVIYDALGRAVAFTSGSTTNEFLYGPSGSKLAVMKGTSLEYALIPLPGGGDAEYYQASGLIAYHHADWLGSERLASTPSGGLYDSSAYGPFGESYAQTGSDPRFTGKISAIATGSHDFLMREYSPTQSRWWTPDPAGLAAVNPSNPQSWNEYAYVAGMPLEATDPLGLNGNCPHEELARRPGARAAETLPWWECYSGRVPAPCAIDGICDLPGGPTGSGPAGGGDPWALGPPGSGGPANSAPPAACTNPESIDTYLAGKGSPMVGEGQDFFDIGGKYNLDPRLLVSIAGAETSFGLNITAGSFNALNDLYNGLNSPFPNWARAINGAAFSLTDPKNNYNLASTATMYATYCTAGKCAQGLTNINIFMSQQGANIDALHFPLCAER
jgi:RHS repeat-associated protein